MTDAVATAPGKIDLGRVISGTFQVIGRNIGNFSILALLLSGLPVAIVGYLQAAWARGLLDDARAGEIVFSSSMLTNGLLGGLTALITTAILQGAIIYATVQDLNGQKASLGDSLATGLRNFLPLIGLSFLLVLAIGFGFVLLIVPGVMLLCAWCVATPALVADRTGVFGAFGRSAQLTRGNRWGIFGLVVLLWIVSLVLSAIFNAVVGISALGASDPARILEAALSPLGILLAVVRQTVTSVVIATAVSVLYVELRRAREGLAPEWLRDIFA